MPGFEVFEYGVLESLITGAAFVGLETNDLTTRMWPMLHSFALLGSAPYRLANSCHFTDRLPNAMSGVELWRLRHLWGYHAFVATKPEH